MSEGRAKPADPTTNFGLVLALKVRSPDRLVESTNYSDGMHHRNTTDTRNSQVVKRLCPRDCSIDPRSRITFARYRRCR